MKKIKREGFTLVEVMMALAIIALVLVSLLNLEISLTRSTSKSTRRLERLYHMRNLMYEASFEAPDIKEEFKKEILKDRLDLIYHRVPIDKKSIFSKFDNLMLESVQADWKTKAGGKTEFLINLKYLPEKKDENKKGNRPS